MKIYKLISTAFLGLMLPLSFTSCVDLNQEPLSFYTMEDYKPGSASFESLANGLYMNFAYGSLSGNNYGFNCRVISMSVGADDVVDGKKTTTRLTYLDQLSLQNWTTDDIKIMWEMLYTTVQASSTLVNGVLAKEVPLSVQESAYSKDTLLMEEKFDVAKYKELRDDANIAFLKDSKKDDIRTFLGEAYFMRALSYFYLVRFWGDVPCFANSLNTKGVDGTVAVQGQVPRTALKDVYEKMIVRDLLLAVELLPAESRSGDSSRPNVWAAKTALADVYMNMAGWPLQDQARYKDCYELCANIIDKGPYDLAKSYDQLWKLNKTTDITEHIFALHHTLAKKNQAANYGMSYYATEENVGGEGWSDYLLDPTFYKSYPDDKRKEFIAVTKFENTYYDPDTKKNEVRLLDYTQSSKKSPAIGKYRDYGGKSSPQTAGITPMYRFAEVLLMYAEAYVKSTGSMDDMSKRCLKRVRARATGQDLSEVTIPTDKDEFLQAVFDEYGWEFVCEGKRWFQLVRTQNVVKQNQINPDIKKVLEARGVTSEAAAQTGRGYLMPIYSKAIDDAKNVGITITQNPGY